MSIEIFGGCAFSYWSCNAPIQSYWLQRGNKYVFGYCGRAENHSAINPEYQQISKCALKQIRYAKGLYELEKVKLEYGFESSLSKIAADFGQSLSKIAEKDKKYMESVRGVK